MMHTVAFIAALIATLADGVTTLIGIRRGYVEVGTLAALLGRRPEPLALAAWTVAELGILAGVYVLGPAHWLVTVAYALAAVATGVIAGRNVRRLRQ